jgi:peptidyl-tRNA hydrolase
VILLAVLAVMSGCESTDNWLKKWTDSDKEAIILGAPGANEYLHEIYELAEGDPATQADMIANAKSAAEITPGTSTQLRYALLLATPGHAESSDIQAQSLLRSLLAEPDLMTPAENALATIHLREVEERLVLRAEADRLRAEIAAAENVPATPTEDAALAQRVANVEAQNRRLRRSLAESEAKIEALSAIERSLRDQSDNADRQ